MDNNPSAEFNKANNSILPGLPGSAESALNELIRAYQDRDRPALQWKKRGGQVIGCLGSDVPEEFLIAAGFLPVRICGDPAANSEIADQYLEPGFDPLVRAQFSRIVDGSYSYLDYLIISNSSDALIRVFYYLRALLEVEPSMGVPELYFFDFLHTHFRLSALYDRDRARDLLEILGNWRGQIVTSEELTRAIALCNQSRQLLQELQTLRGPQPPRLAGSQALELIGALQFMPRQEYNELLKTFLEQAHNLISLKGVRLFVTGSTQDHTGFYELVESCGAIIVGEDHEMGSRLFTSQVDPSVDPIEAIVDRYQLRPPSSSQATISERVEALVNQVRASGAEGVIFFIHTADDAPSWDFPAQRKALAELGLPVLLLDNQPYVNTNIDEFNYKITGFIESIVENTQRAI